MNHYLITQVKTIDVYAENLEEAESLGREVIHAAEEDHFEAQLLEKEAEPSEHAFVAHKD